MRYVFSVRRVWSHNAIVPHECHECQGIEVISLHADTNRIDSSALRYWYLLLQNWKEIIYAQWHDILCFVYSMTFCSHFTFNSFLWASDAIILCRLCTTTYEFACCLGLCVMPPTEYNCVCVRACVCVCVCVRVCVCECVCECLQACVCACGHMCMYVCMYVYMRACVYICLCMCVGLCVCACVHASMRVCACVCVCVYMIVQNYYSIITMSNTNAYKMYMFLGAACGSPYIVFIWTSGV